MTPSLSLRLLGALAGSFALAAPALANPESTPIAESTTPPTAEQLSQEKTAPPSELRSTLVDIVPPQPTVTLEESAAAPAPEFSPGQPSSSQPSSSQPSSGQPSSDKPAVTPTLKILAPTPAEVLDVPAATVVLQFPIGKTAKLLVNGVPVDPALIGRTETDPNSGWVRQTWYGVALKEGDNRISAELPELQQSGLKLEDSVTVSVRGAVAKLVVRTAQSRIPADGRSQATVQGELLDPQGNRSNRDSVVTLLTTAGEFVGTDAAPDQPGFQVKASQGQFTAQLKAGLEAKTVRLRASASDLEAFTQLNFETNLRSSIATGVLDVRLGKRGTDFFRSFRDFLPADRDYSTQLDVRSAGFATGRIGEWLFTGAYNTERPLNQTCDGNVRLFRELQDCEHTYPTYGDTSQSTVVAPSIDSLFLRLERSSKVPGAATDYAMWGDYNTEEFATKSQEFTATTRQLHGFKGNYNLGNLQLTGFYADRVEGFQRDAIAPDGTSGYYFLSRRDVVEGSEDIYLELEELNRPGTVLDRKRLSRGPDYEIDYSRGTLLFREPILRTDVAKDGTPLVRRIITTYQHNQIGGEAKIYGARAQYHFSRGQERWLGATYLKQDQGLRDFELWGLDSYISLGPNSRLVAEYAQSRNELENAVNPGQGVTGDALRVELDGQLSPSLSARAYYRSASAGFANNATVSFTPGQTRYGAQASAKLGPQTNLRLQYDHERNQGIAPQLRTGFEDLFSPRYQAAPGSAVDDALTTLSLGVQHKIGAADVSLDYLHRDRTDRITQQETRSDQLRSRLSLPLAKDLTFLAQSELSLSKRVDPIYSDRSVLGLNWAVVPGVNVQLAHQLFHRGQYAGQSLTQLSLTGDYKLGPDTLLSGRYSLIGGEQDRWSPQGAIGLQQKIQITPGLKLNLAYEHVFNSGGRNAASNTFLQPWAPGQSSASLGLQGGDSYSVGLDYADGDRFQANARWEHRASSGGNTTLNIGASGKLSPSLTVLGRYQQANAANQTLVALQDTSNLKLGLAYRDPNSDKLNILLRYEARKNPSTIPDTLLLGSGTGSRAQLFALETIYAPSWRWEFYGKLALRQSRSYLADDLVSRSAATLGQVRATYRLGYSWDLAGEARWINQGGYRETGLALEAGYYLTPNLRLSAGYSFGKAGDRDFEGTRSASGPYFGLTVKLNDWFNGFGLQQPSRAIAAPAAPTVSSAKRQRID
jgi:hypothetical protein